MTPTFKARHRSTTPANEDDDDEPILPQLPEIYRRKPSVESFGSISFSEPAKEPPRFPYYPQMEVTTIASTSTTAQASVHEEDGDGWFGINQSSRHQPVDSRQKPDNDWEDYPEQSRPSSVQSRKASTSRPSPIKIHEVETGEHTRAKPNQHGPSIYGNQDKWPPTYSRTTAAWFMPYPSTPRTTTMTTTTEATTTQEPSNVQL